MIVPNVEQSKRIGESYLGEICEDCKLRIAGETAKLSKIDMLNPIKVAQRFKDLLCPDCTIKILKAMRARQ